ncbi:MAG: C39 family peptidase [Treponema sp.]|jgi:hypothetical protein|nr:C39 family peptidase [Treponema sp.]
MYNSYADFSKGTLTDTVVLEKGNGVIELKKTSDGTYPVKGIYESPEIESEPFVYMVLSWNTDTPYGTSVKIDTRVRVNGAWSKWLLVGTWSSGAEKASAMSSDQGGDNIAYVDTDTVTIKRQNDETADKYGYRLTLMTEDVNVTPTVRLVTAAFKNTQKDQEIEKIPGDVSQDAVDIIDAIDAFTGTLDVKPYSQMIRDPQFSSAICSAVSSCMILDYKGVHILPEMAAMGVLDTYYDGYGNWPFNAAFIASFGFESYIEYCAGLDDIKRELMMNNPVICSVRYKRDDSVDGNLPVLSAAPIDRTPGHLIVVVGYERDENGKTYVIVNDPAAEDDVGVRRRYDEKQFMAAWSASKTVAYKTHGKVKDAGGSAPVVEDAALVPMGRERETDGVYQREYMIIGKTSGLVSAAKAVNPHNPNFETGVSIVVWDDAKDAVHSYITPTHGNAVWLNEDQANKTVYIFLKSGRYYKARQ